MKISRRRVWGVMLRHLYNFRHNLDRIVDAFYWPSLDVVIWGMTISALQKQGTGTFAQIAAILFGVILWYVLLRGQYEFTIGLLEELWSENLANLLSTPLTTLEWVLGLCLIGIMKLVLTIVFTAFVAWILYAANFFSLGFALIPFIASLLIMGWAFGLFVAGLFLRFGTDIQTLAWTGGFMLMPFSATFYPLSALPIWVQKISVWLPSTYVFEGMRALVYTGEFMIGHVEKSLLLDTVYLLLALVFFISSLRLAKIRGIAHLK